LQGVVERTGKVRLIRDGRVIYPEAGSGKEVGIQSLRRVKDDVREVREGFECGIKIAGYDDVKEGDVIEVYKIEQMQRTL
jgi:translation initiation factor IF-2